jgi:cell division protein FtsA
MAKKNLITALDIGSSKIKVLGVLKKGENLDIAFQSEKKSEGVRKGVVVDPDVLSRILSEIFSEIKKESGFSPNLVFSNINGAHLFSLPSHSIVIVSRADQKISEEDVQRSFQTAQAVSLSPNKEIFDTIPIEFSIDGEKGIKDPVGLGGVKLEADVLMLGGFSPYIRNLEKSILNSGLEIEDLVPSPIAASKSCLTQKQKELGVALIDIGASTTGISIFKDENLIKMVILPIGSADITNEIAMVLKIDVEVAERIKTEFGTCLFKGKDERERIEIGEEEPLIFSLRSLSKVIEKGVLKIFSEIEKELKKISKEKFLPAGIVLTGGGAKIQKISDLAKKKFKLPVKIGKPKGIPGIEDPSFSVAVGLILGGIESEREKISQEGLFSKIKRIFRIFLP